jgi:branched-chain amino acid transport system substrate-binding protein
VDDGQMYGRFLASGIKRYAATVHLQRVGSAHLDYSTPARNAQTAAAVADQIQAIGPDVVYCGCDGESAAALASALHHRAFTGSFVGGDSIHGDGWLRMVGASSKTYASDIGIDLSRLPGWFRRAYSARFHTELTPFSAYAYDAASVALGAMYAAVTHHELHGSMFGKRAAVVARVARTCYRGATGITAFDANGDTRNRVVSIYTARESSWQFATTVRVGAAPACH